MKIFNLAPRENWICDRISEEWYEYYKKESTKDPIEADLIWLQAGWCWNHLSMELLKSKKIVCTEHHIVPEKFTQKSLNEFVFRDQFVDAYHVPNPHTKTIVEKLTKKPVKLLNYWFDSKKWYPGDRQESRFKLGFESSSFIIGSFQRDSEGETANPKLEKGPDIFCDYVEKIASKKENVKVLLGGWRRKYVIKRLDEAGIPYTLLELVPNDTLRHMYLSCDLYVVSSRYEGGPQALLEAPATLTPIITNNIGIAKQTVVDDCIIDVSKEIYFPTEKDTKNNYNNILKYKIENQGKLYLDFFKQVIKNE